MAQGVDSDLVELRGSYVEAVAWQDSRMDYVARRDSQLGSDGERDALHLEVLE